MTSTARAAPVRPLRRPIRVAIVNDYRVVLAGLRAMLADDARVEVIELDANAPVASDVDVVLYDTFADAEADLAALGRLRGTDHVGHLVVFSWDFDPRAVRTALDEVGASGYLSKTLAGPELVGALERIVAGEVVVDPAPRGTHSRTELRWPGEEVDLSEREAEVLALITQGRSNDEIAGLLHLSPNTIKTYVRSAYRKIGARNRVDAVLWGTSHGMAPDRQRLRADAH